MSTTSFAELQRLSASLLRPITDDPLASLPPPSPFSRNSGVRAPALRPRGLATAARATRQPTSQLTGIVFQPFNEVRAGSRDETK